MRILKSGVFDRGLTGTKSMPCIELSENMEVGVFDRGLTKSMPCIELSENREVAGVRQGSD